MAVTAYNPKIVAWYTGLSTDTKPTARVEAGSLFQELDTGVVYEYDGTTWFPLAQGFKQSSWSVTSDSTANAAVTLSRAAETGKRHYITAFEAVLRGAAAGADTRVELRNGATVMWDTYIGNAAPRGERVGAVFTHPIELTANTAANLVVAAAGASALTTVSMSGFTL